MSYNDDDGDFDGSSFVDTEIEDDDLLGEEKTEHNFKFDEEEEDPEGKFV